MGISWSKRHNRNQHHHHHHHPPPLPPSSSSLNPSSSIILPPTTPTPPQPTSPPHGFNPPSYAFAANAPHYTTQPPGRHPYPPVRPRAPPPPPPPLPPYNYSYNFPNYHSRPVNIMSQYPNYRPYYIPQVSGWGPSVAPLHPPPQVQPAPYVDHQSAKKIKNDVNVHKDTIRLQLDDLHPDCHLVSFTFDALVDGSITIYYFAKERDKCRFTPVYPEIVPVKIPFQKGVGQKFCQPSGTGVDLGFFDIDDLSKPVPGEDAYPLVISAESCVPSTPMDERTNEERPSASPHAQITQAILEKNNSENFQVKVIKQILWIDGARYELREIFGISDSDEAAVNDVESAKECIICLTEAKNTAVLPCRHMCLCSECAKELRLQSNKCPVCRQPIVELLEIKVDEEAGV